MSGHSAEKDAGLRRTVGPDQGPLYAAQQIANRHRPTTRNGKPYCIECDYYPAPAGCPTWQLIGDVLRGLTRDTSSGVGA